MIRQRLVYILPVILLVLCTLKLIVVPPSSVRAVYTNPSGDYLLVVHSYYRVFALPGDSTGSRGYVDLFDRSGKKPGEAKVALVLEVSSPNDIHWYDHNVMVPGAFDFPLPS